MSSGESLSPEQMGEQVSDATDRTPGAQSRDFCGVSGLRRARVRLHARLQTRRREIEQALVARVYAIDPPARFGNIEYIDGLRITLTTALDYALDAVEFGEQHAPVVPLGLLTQARLAARYGVGLDTVLRRYVAGYSLLTEVIIQETADDGLLRDTVLRRLLDEQAIVFDRLIANVGHEYTREAASHPSTPEQRRTERVRRLLEGEPIDPTELNYNLEALHIGMVAQGPTAADTIRGLAVRLGKRLLMVQREEETVWAWLGFQHGLDSANLECVASANPSPRTTLAIGEIGMGLGGWRLTHRQALAALSIARRCAKSLVRYLDIALLASISRDDLLATSLRELYLAPLERERDGGERLRGALRAYFSSGRNVSSAASALGVSRRTVANRLRAVEQIIGCPIATGAADIEAALRLQELDDASTSEGHAQRSTRGGSLL
jgi:hypothetical protein